MHEDCALSGLAHELLINSIRRQDFLAPCCIRLAHRDPSVRHHAIGAFNGFLGIVCQGDRRLLAPRPFHGFIFRLERIWTAKPQREAKTRGRMHPGHSDVVAITNPGNRASLYWTGMLFKRHDVGHDLARVTLVRQSVDDGDRCMLGEFDKGFVRIGADHDGVGIARENASRIGNGFAASQLQIRMIER